MDHADEADLLALALEPPFLKQNAAGLDRHVAAGGVFQFDAQFLGNPQGQHSGENHAEEAVQQSGAYEIPQCEPGPLAGEVLDARALRIPKPKDEPQPQQRLGGG